METSFGGNLILDGLQKIQNRAARIITKSTYDTLPEPLLSELDWKSIRELIRHDKTVMMFKCLSNLGPGYLSMFESFEDLYLVRLQSSKTDLWPPKLDTTTGQRSFSCHGVQVWNSLGENKNRASSLQLFKSSI